MKSYKLNDIYLTWNDNNVWLIPKSKGTPSHKRYFDPKDWDQLQLAPLFFDWFLILTTGSYNVPRQDPDDVHEVLRQIVEFRDFDDKLAENLTRFDTPAWMAKSSQSAAV